MRTLLAEARAQRSPEDVQRRIQLNLARARVLPGPWAMHIVVDTASGQLWYYQAGCQQGMMRVVVGKQAPPTPMLVGTVQWAILNPYWNVPVDLAQTLIAPRMLTGRTLKSMNMEALSDWTESAQVLRANAIDRHAVAAGTQELRLRQLPGAYNSMGKVKFLFANDFGIYLHDTPERELLAKDDRHFSNRCIRLEDADRLARWLLGKPLRAFSRQPEQVVSLPVAVPVYVTYFTAQAGAGGQIAMRDDVYGRDRPRIALRK
jgi:murein L,D-transpeptidase YcbB/YkuD